MMKLLIVDDERIIRETIASLVDWESLGITLIGTAENGIEMCIRDRPSSKPGTGKKLPNRHSGVTRKVANYALLNREFPFHYEKALQRCV